MSERINDVQLRDLIRQVVAETGSTSNQPFELSRDGASGVMAVRTATVNPAPFDTGKPGDKVFLSDLFSLQESPRLGCGVMEMEKSSFDWVLNYDEIDYIIEGRLEIVIGERKVIGEAGDVILIPKNTAIQFSVPDFARFLYVTYPADWEQQSQSTSNQG
jgi:ethanolamine utilization protein EutQ